MQLERKSLLLTDYRPEVKADGDGPGLISGHASTFGNIDSYGDTIQPGAYTAGLTDFLRNGFLAWQHDWDEDIGFPVEAREDTVGLYFTGQFYPDPEAQQRRDRTKARLTAGKSVGLSIGYIPTKFSFREIDGRTVRVLEEIKLFEISIVMVPADQFAGVDEAKSASMNPATALIGTKAVELAPPGFKDLGDFYAATAEWQPDAV